MKHEHEAYSGFNTRQAVEYLEARGISQQMQTDLRIQYLTYSEAITERWGFGKQATSPDGVIAFPVSEGVAIARNFYTSPERQAEHLLAINRQRSQNGLEPTKKVPKYVVPQGDRGKGILYDPYKQLNNNTDVPILFVTEDIFGVIKAAHRDIRILSAVGVWLVTNAELQSDERPVFGDRVQVFIADSDALENALVCRAMIRNGVVLKCRIGCFPSPNKSLKIGLDEWLDRNPNATESDLQSLVQEHAYDALDWVKIAYPNLHAWLRDRGYSTTESLQIAAVVREGIQKELLQQFGLETLRSGGIYQEILKPSGVTLASLQRQAKSDRSAGEDEKTKVVNLLIEIGQEAKLFHDVEQQTYADIEVDGSRQTHKIGSRGFKLWLYRKLYEREGISASREVYSAAINTLESIALFDGVEQQVWLRTAEHQGKFYLDLANDGWQAVEIDGKGWRVVDRPPVRFIRPATVLEIPTPSQDGSLEELRDLLGLSDSDWAIAITFLGFCLLAGKTYPVLFLSAPRGSGKTTTAEYLKKLIDPGKAPLINLSADVHKMAVAGLRRWLMCYDNISHISPSESDCLCRLATGFGYSTRTLFTTDEETVFEVCRPQILTAIDHVVVRDDLSDRTIMISLPPIPEEKLRPKAELDQAFEQIWPSAIGALLDVVSRSLATMQTMAKPEKLPRMADYGLFAIAAETHLGLGQGEVVNILAANRETARQVVLEASPLGEAIQRMFEKTLHWEGTASELLIKLEDFADRGIVGSRYWPKASNSLKRQLNRLKPDLEAMGIQVEDLRIPGTGTRLIKLEKRIIVSRSQRGVKISSQSSQPENETLKPPFDKGSSCDDICDDTVTILSSCDDIVTPIPSQPNSIPSQSDSISSHPEIPSQKAFEEDSGSERDDICDDTCDDTVTIKNEISSHPETHSQKDFEQGHSPSCDDCDDISTHRLSREEKKFAVGDIVIALKNVPGQKIGIPKGAWGEIIMPECNGLIRVQFDQGVKDIPVQNVELAS